jgi:outer membrane protein assembly factor BamB
MLQRLQAVAVLIFLFFGFVVTKPTFAQQSTAYQINRAHTGFIGFSLALAFPLTQLWSVSLPDSLSYPVIAEGRVFVLSRSINGDYGTILYALDAQSGSILWRKRIPGTYYWAAHTYGDNRLYVLNYNGRLRAFDPLTGSLLWSRQMPGQYAFSAAPTFSNGIIYLCGSGGGGTLYAVDGIKGSVIWTQGVENGDQSSPAVSDNAVFVSYGCNQAYRFDASSGALIWHHPSGCSGGGGKTTILSRYGLFTRDWDGNLILDLKTGNELGRYNSYVAPAFGGQYRFSLANGRLWARNQESNTHMWSFSGDGTLSSAPIVVNSVVFIGGTSGMLYALNRVSGKVIWRTNVGSAIPAPDEQNVSQPLTGLAAGEGLIVVPASNRLVAYGN